MQYLCALYESQFASVMACGVADRCGAVHDDGVVLYRAADLCAVGTFKRHAVSVYLPPFRTVENLKDPLSQSGVTL